MPNFAVKDNKWYHLVNESGTINIASGNKYMDRNIDIEIPEASVSTIQSIDSEKIEFETENNSGLLLTNSGGYEVAQRGFIGGLKKIAPGEFESETGVVNVEDNYLKTIHFDKPIAVGTEYYFNIIDCQGTNWLWKTDSSGNVYIEGTD